VARKLLVRTQMLVFKQTCVCLSGFQYTMVKTGTPAYKHMWVQHSGTHSVQHSRFTHIYGLLLWHILFYDDVRIFVIFFLNLGIRVPRYDKCTSRCEWTTKIFDHRAIQSEQKPLLNEPYNMKLLKIKINLNKERNRDESEEKLGILSISKLM
jgi:hypothetical protein